jgi:hypothetical protein
MCEHAAMDKYTSLIGDLLPGRLPFAARQPAAESLRDLIPGLEESHQISRGTRGPENPVMFLVVAPPTLFRVTLHEASPRHTLEVRPIPLDDVHVQACHERIEQPGRLRTWDIALPGDQVIHVETEQHEGNEPSAADRFVRALARLKGWSTGSADPTSTP